MTKPKTPEAPADEGSGGPILMETERGIFVCRPLKSLMASVLPAESLDDFMRLLDRYVEFGDREDAIRHYWNSVGGLSISHETFRARAVDADADQKSARRDMIVHLKKIRAAPAKNLDDILFKAEICAVLEPYDVRDRRTIAHSIINDLLSAGCIWTAEIEQGAS